MMRRSLLALCMALLAGACGESAAGGVHQGVPARLDPARTYVFYLSGAEGAKALAAQGLDAILEPRPAGHDDDTYAVLVWERIRELLARGVPMRRIGLAGEGAGGRLAMMAAGLGQVPEMGLAVLNACPRTGEPGREDYERVLRLHAFRIKGRFLSVREVGGSGCGEAFQAANGADTWEVEAGPAAWAREAAAWLRL